MSTVCLNIEKELFCDVLVVGGGCAGFSAAVCAARGDTKVILAERNGYLGGTATSGMVGPFMTSYDTDGEKQLICGFFDEFVTRLEQVGGAVKPDTGDFELGDVNMDTKVNIKDATAIQKYSAKMAEFDEIAMILADFDGDGKINVKDATAIQKKIAGFI